MPEKMFEVNVHPNYDCGEMQDVLRSTCKINNKDVVFKVI